MFKCANLECKKFDEPKQSNARFKFNESTNKLEPVNPPKCSECGKVLVEHEIEGDYEAYWFRGPTQKMWSRSSKGTIY